MRHFFTTLFSLIKARSACAVCKQKAFEPRHYLNDAGRSVKVCMKCVPYAERRALRKR